MNDWKYWATNLSYVRGRWNSFWSLTFCMIYLHLFLLRWASTKAHTRQSCESQYERALYDFHMSWVAGWERKNFCEASYSLLFAVSFTVEYTKYHSRRYFVRGVVIVFIAVLQVTSTSLNSQFGSGLYLHQWKRSYIRQQIPWSKIVSQSKANDSMCNRTKCWREMQIFNFFKMFNHELYSRSMMTPARFSFMVMVWNRLKYKCSNTLIKKH